MLVGRWVWGCGDWAWAKSAATSSKLLGVLSLQALPRRLALDFRDVFSDGFSFDFIRGDVTIQDGIAATNNLQMKGVNAGVLMEVHTHPQPGMPAFFSHIDDEEERGFRLYGVIGRISRGQGTIEAEIRMRVVIYGVDVASYEFPASWVLSLPEGMRECAAPGAPATGEDARWE